MDYDFISVNFDKRMMESIEQKLKDAPKEVQKAGVFAINRTIDMTKTKMLKNATERYTIKRRELTNSLRMRKANYSNLNAEISSFGSVIGLDHFKLYPKKRPKRYINPLMSSEIKGSKKSQGRNAFIPYKSGFLGAFKRVAATRTTKLITDKVTKKVIGGGKRIAKRSESIKRLMGPSAPQMLGNKDWLPEVETFMEEKLNERFIHELNRIL